jgi:shikimate 5-dehydrogenase
LKPGDPLPCPEDLLGPGLLVLDAPYQPGGTALAHAARKAGAEVMDGYTLLLAQAAGQAELFTRRPTSALDLLNKLPLRLQSFFTFSEKSGGPPPRSYKEVSS